MRDNLAAAPDRRHFQPPVRLHRPEPIKKGAVMSRRLVPCIFLTLLFVGVVLPLALRAYASGPPSRVPSLKGNWEGVFQVLDDTGEMGLIRSVIDQQDYRRFQGDAEFFLAID